MISKSWSRKSIATAVAVAVLSVYSMVVLAAPGAKASGELSVSGQVTVNGQKVISGGTVFTDSTISTAAQSSASVSISKVGRVELAPNSNLRLSFRGEQHHGNARDW
jgi:phage baseplate assembly protein gpV